LPPLVRSVGDQSANRRVQARGAALLVVTALVFFFVTGVGLFEGYVVYPSWMELATFPGFAAYHATFGNALLPWLPGPLGLALVLTAAMLKRSDHSRGRAVVIALLAGQLLVVGVTAVLVIPIQQELSAPGHTPEEIRELVMRLRRLSVWRDVPGVAVACGFAWMLHRAVRTGGAQPRGE
jgi:hypothetical protein